MKTSNIIWAIIIAVIVLGGWYLWMQSSTPAPMQTDTTTASSDQTGQPSTTTTVTTQTQTTATTQTTPTGDGSAPAENLTLGTDSKSGVGTYLIADNGMTLYTYSGDTAGVSNCTGGCATNWPPYTVPAGMQLNLQAGVTGAASSIARADGTTQVTYKGKPLYFFVGDTASGSVAGNGDNGFTVAKP